MEGYVAPPLNVGYGFKGLHWTPSCPSSSLRSIWGKPKFRVGQICPLSQADRNLLLMPLRSLALSKDRVAFSAHCRSSDPHWAHCLSESHMQGQMSAFPAYVSVSELLRLSPHRLSLGLKPDLQPLSLTWTVTFLL